MNHRIRKAMCSLGLHNYYYLQTIINKTDTTVIMKCRNCPKQVKINK